MTETKKKMFIFQQRNKKSVQFDGKERLFFEKSLDSRYFNFSLHEYWKIKTHISGLFFIAHQSTRAQIEAFIIKKKLLNILQ